MSDLLQPRNATALIGHEAAEAELRDAFASGRMHHAWLISGPKGIGKATLAWRVARYVLVPSGDERAERRMSAGAHADLLVLEPPEDPEKDEAKREIPVEQARAAGAFLAHTPAESDWRVLIVDSADEMNLNAANALLKSLEEPPSRSLLLLVSHNPGRLLPTIRSRCRNLRLHPLQMEDFQEVMRLHAPELSTNDVDRLGTLARFSPGVALFLHAHDGLALYAEFVRLVAQDTPVGTIAFADRIGSGTIHANWQAFSWLAERFFSRTIETSLGNSFAEATPGEGAAMRALLSALPPQAVAALQAQASEQFSVASRLHLDYKSVLMGFMQGLQRPRAA